MITGVRLIDGPREMIVYPRDGISPQALEVDWPEIREVTEPRTDDDGTRDTTVLFGARAVSLEVVIYKDPASVEELLNEFKNFLHPRSRPYLYVTDDEWGQERRIGLRVNQMGAPYDGYAARRRRKVQLQWKAPDGIWEDSSLTETTVNADIDVSAGISFPITFPLAFDTAVASGVAIIPNQGGTPSHFVARLYGPCTGPELTNETTGETIKFTGGDTGLSIAAGDYLEINTKDRTAYLLSMTDASRLSYVDFTATSWWRIEPGENLVRYHPSDDVGPGASAVIEFRQAWL